MKVLSYFLLAAIFLSSCVSVRKYDEMRLAKEYWEQEADSIDSLRQESTKLDEELRETNLQLSDSYYDLEQLEATNRNLQRNYEDILARFNRTIDRNDRVISASSMERMGLTEDLAAKQAQLDQRERELLEMDYMLQQRERRLNSTQDDLGYMQDEVMERERRISELMVLLEQEGVRMGNLENSINSDLRDFNQNELNVSGRDGKIYLGLSEELLFRSGSSTIGSRGRRAIAQIARTLNSGEYADLSVVVEGHTDSDGSSATNWDLSVTRATAVVKELTKNRVSPDRIVAAGRGEYAPIRQNSSSRNKALNRRVEIILSPNYEEIINSSN
ncbi:MAG: OmpA family protein [Bacteroidota bacterium]